MNITQTLGEEVGAYVRVPPGATISVSWSTTDLDSAIFELHKFGNSGLSGPAELLATLTGTGGAQSGSTIVYNESAYDWYLRAQAYQVTTFAGTIDVTFLIGDADELELNGRDLSIVGISPAIFLQNEAARDALADASVWRLTVDNSGTLTLVTRDDDRTTGENALVITRTGNAVTEVRLQGDKVSLNAATLAVFGTTGTTQQTITGNRLDPESALKNLLTALAGYKLIVDSTTAT